MSAFGFNRRLPHESEAEFALLGAMLADPGCWKRLPPELRSDHFTDPDHRLVFDAIMEMRDAGGVPSAVSLKAWFEANNELSVEGPLLLDRLLEKQSPNPGWDVQLANAILQAGRRRQIIEISTCAIDDAYACRPGETAEEIAAATAASIAAIGAVTQQTNGAEIIDARALCEEAFPPLDPLVDKLLAPGLTILASKPKVGKSWLLLALGLAVAGGRLALGELRTKRADALLLMLEDSPRRLQSRLLTLADKEDVPAGLHLATQWSRGDDAVADVRRYLDANPACRLIGVDILGRVRDQQQNGGNGKNLYQADYDALAPWQQLAAERNVAIVIVHHMRKADAEDAVDSLSGTLGLAGAADHIITIGGNRDAGYSLSLTGRDLLPIDWSMSLDGGHWSIIGDKPRKGKHLDVVEKIDLHNNIRERHEQGMTYRAISKELGCSLNQVVQAMKDNPTQQRH